MTMVIRKMKQTSGKRPKTFNDKLSTFMRESDTKQEDIYHRNNKNVRRKRKEFFAHRTEDT